MRRVRAGGFKAKCLAVIDEVAATGEPVLVTKRGKPAAKVVPPDAVVKEKEPESIFGVFRVMLIAHVEKIRNSKLYKTLWSAKVLSQLVPYFGADQV